MDDRSAAYQLYVGIDVAAASFTAAWLPVGGTPSPAFAADQAPTGYAALQRRLRATAPPPAVYHEVRQRLVARDALLTMRQQARNQRHALLQWPVVVEGVQRHLDELIAH